MSMEGGSPECEYLLRIARAAGLRSNPGTYAYGFAGQGEVESPGRQTNKTAWDL